MMYGCMLYLYAVWRTCMAYMQAYDIHVWPYGMANGITFHAFKYACLIIFRIC